MAAFLEVALALDFKRRLLTMGAHDKLCPLRLAPCFYLITIRETKHAMTAHSITTVGSAPPIFALQRKFHILALMLDSIIGQRHPTALELLCTHPVPII